MSEENRKPDLLKGEKRDKTALHCPTELFPIMELFFFLTFAHIYIYISLLNFGAIFYLRIDR